MKLEYATFSEAGVRPSNEDYKRVVEMPDNSRTMFILCDIMRGPYGQFRQPDGCDLHQQLLHT